MKKRTFEFRVGAALNCTVVDNDITLNHVDVMHKAYLTNDNWQGPNGHYTQEGLDMVLFGFSAATIGMIHAAEQHSGMDPAKLLRQVISQLELLFVERSTSVVHKG